MSLPWLKSIFGWSRPSPPAAGKQLPPTERLGDVLKRGGTLRDVQASDFAHEFASRLREVCRGDTNVAGVWLGWLSDGDSSGLVAVLQLDRVDEQAIRRFVAHVNALDGPRCIATVPEKTPTGVPFYQRGVQSGSEQPET